MSFCLYFKFAFTLARKGHGKTKKANRKLRENQIGFCSDTTRFKLSLSDFHQAYEENHKYTTPFSQTDSSSLHHSEFSHQEKKTECLDSL